MGSDISICNGDPKSTPSVDITLCDGNKKPQSEDIVLCDRTSSDCDKATALTLTGSSAPGNGSQYVASGGVPPYLFSSSAGSISADGVLSGISSACGSGSVSVTDKCGKSAIVDVRWSSGIWVLINHWVADFSSWPNCIGPSGCINSDGSKECGYNNNTDYTCYSGNQKIIEGRSGWCYSSSQHSASKPQCPGVTYADLAIITQRDTYEWQCP